MPPVFALVDCNNFYASCEKLFRPDLQQAPVIVLSNNDGCVVARSKEAKALGIKMGVPVHQIQDVIHHEQVVIFSSNYALYADISHRVMTTLASLTPEVEVYSIDEAFCEVSGLERLQSLTELGLHIRATVQQHIGMTVCVGMAPSKTLAKLANYAAKKYPGTQGVVDLTSPERQQRLLELVPVEEVWGVGRKISKRLNALGITTAWQLAQANPKAIRKQFSVVLERTVKELNGQACFTMQTQPPAKQQIVVSRSFGQRITNMNLMREAISDFIATGCYKLRQEQRKARIMAFYFTTSYFAQGPRHSGHRVIRLAEPSDDPRVFSSKMNLELPSLWRDGFPYAKAGVMFGEFERPDAIQLSLFDQGNSEKSQRLLATIDQIHAQGIGRLYFASQGNHQPHWQTKREHRSPRYTTNWTELARVK